MTAHQPTVLVCRCVNANLVAQAAVERVIGQLQSDGRAVVAVDDLCGLAARGDARLAGAVNAAGESLVVAACFPRTIRWLLDWAGAPLPVGAKVLNLRAGPPDDVLAELRDPPGGADRGARPRVDEERAPLAVAAKAEIADDWVPWFPIIDYDRCKACRKCANFCLFAVYSIQPDGTVRVAQPAKCKTNCPACARLCPHAAIIFAKYEAAPINGEEVTAENAAAQFVGQACGIKIGQDLLSTLRQRAASLASEPLSIKEESTGAAPPHSPLPGGDGKVELPASVQQILGAMKKDRPSGT